MDHGFGAFTVWLGGGASKLKATRFANDCRLVCILEPAVPEILRGGMSCVVLRGGGEGDWSVETLWVSTGTECIYRERYGSGTALLAYSIKVIAVHIVALGQSPRLPTS